MSEKDALETKKKYPEAVCKTDYPLSPVVSCFECPG